MEGDMASRMQSVVDEYVDEMYLAACGRAWGITNELAQSILDALNLGEVDPSDQHRWRCVEWLRRAAVHRMPTRLPHSAISSTGALDPTDDLLRHVAGAYPRFLHGTASGQSILLAGEGMRLWHDYFRSRNYLYRPLNAGAAATVNHILRSGSATRILEVGAGTGGATAHLLAEWPTDLDGPYDYTVTDTSASLMVSARRALSDVGPPNVRLGFRRFDFDLAVDQRLAPGSFDIVFAVNAVHNATDLPFTLRRLRSLLRKGGTLVLSESLCAPGDLVHQEIIFNLLPIPADAYHRGSRFYDKAAWNGIFDAAGIVADVQVNATGPQLAMVAIAEAEGAP